MTTYSFLLDSTKYNKARTYYMSTNDETTTVNTTLADSFQCQLMVSWDSQLEQDEIVAGIPFFRQFTTMANFSDLSKPQLKVYNNSISNNFFLQDATAQEVGDGKFEGIVAFVIVLASLAGFMFLAWLIWFIHQKMHARDMNWTPEDALETE